VRHAAIMSKMNNRKGGNMSSDTENGNRKSKKFRANMRDSSVASDQQIAGVYLRDKVRNFQVAVQWEITGSCFAYEGRRAY